MSGGVVWRLGRATEPDAGYGEREDRERDRGPPHAPWSQPRQVAGLEPASDSTGSCCCGDRASGAHGADSTGRPVARRASDAGGDVRARLDWLRRAVENRYVVGFRIEPVADAEVRVDVAPSRRGGLELLAQLADEHVDGA